MNMFLVNVCPVAGRDSHSTTLRSISETSSCFSGPRPWHIEIRHRVKKTSTINLSGFETLKLKSLKIEIMETDRVVFAPSLAFAISMLCSPEQVPTVAKGVCL